MRVLAYPMQKILPHWKQKGQEGQRKLAFLFSMAGYSAAFVIFCGLEKYFAMCGGILKRTAAR